jgi:hypothetical protein
VEGCVSKDLSIVIPLTTVRTQSLYAISTTGTKVAVREDLPAGVDPILHPEPGKYTYNGPLNARVEALEFIEGLVLAIRLLSISVKELLNGSSLSGQRLRLSVVREEDVTVLVRFVGN